MTLRTLASFSLLGGLLALPRWAPAQATPPAAAAPAPVWRANLTQADVVGVLGEPSMHMQKGGQDVYLFKNGTRIEVLNGKVTTFDGPVPNALRAVPLSNPEPPAAPAATPPVAAPAVAAAPASSGSTPAAKSPSSGSTPASPAKSTVFTSTAGRFSINTPRPMEQAAKFVNAESLVITIHTFTYTGRFIVSVNYWDFDPSKMTASANKTIEDDIMDGFGQEFVRSLNGENPVETKITLNNSPGRELTFEGRMKDGTTVSAKSRLYVVKNRVYQETVVTPHNTLSAAEVDAYLNSFKVL